MRARNFALKIALMSAGAYGFTMSSNYNTRPRVAEVMVANATHQLVRKREGHSWRHQQWQMRARNFALKIQLW
jgi:hypothetical protein